MLGKPDEPQPTRKERPATRMSLSRVEKNARQAG